MNVTVQDLNADFDNAVSDGGIVRGASKGLDVAVWALKADAIYARLERMVDFNQGESGESFVANLVDQVHEAYEGDYSDDQALAMVLKFVEGTLKSAEAKSAPKVDENAPELVN